MSAIEQERLNRLRIWERVGEEGRTAGLLPKELSELGIYRGGTGIWVDRARTQDIVPQGVGVTVSLLHTGGAYADDLFDDGLLYHYPRTRRSPARDRMEIEATKAAGELGIPVFVLAGPAREPKSVHLGWVEDWDDVCGLFMIAFGQTPPADDPLHVDEFHLFDTTSANRSPAPTRPGQRAFHFGVLKRYGPRCSVCDTDQLALLDAAHIVPWREGGTDDPRNGIVFCALHHRAFDAGLFSVEPTTLAIMTRPDVLGLAPVVFDVSVVRPSLGTRNVCI